ncbi:MAG: hypothetical protein LN567_06685 [Rickettsia endosymbiont of Graphium doson]|nr:hypothetical protein [Rickettsia endosymbiont of Graphium doson]
MEAVGRNASHVWETLSVILEKAQGKGVTYLSLGRGWDGKQDIAGGKKILDLMSQNLQATRNDPLKSKIFNILLEETDKKEQGLFAIPDSHKKYPTVMKAYAEYKALVEDSEFVVLGVQFNTLEIQIEAEPQQSGLGNNAQNPPLDVKGRINSINELLKNYNEELKNLTEMGLDAEAIKTILETGDTKNYLLTEAKELTKELLKYYGNLSILEKGFFKDSEVCNKYNKLATDIRAIDISLSDDLRYPLTKIMLNVPKNPFEYLGELFGGQSAEASEQILKDFIIEYENTHTSEEVNSLGDFSYLT